MSGPSPAPPPTIIADDPDVVAAVAEDEAIWLQVAVVRSPETLESFLAPDDIPAR